jgi:hypothetical protein
VATASRHRAGAGRARELGQQAAQHDPGEQLGLHEHDEEPEGERHDRDGEQPGDRGLRRGRRRAERHEARHHEHREERKGGRGDGRHLAPLGPGRVAQAGEEDAAEPGGRDGDERRGGVDGDGDEARQRDDEQRVRGARRGTGRERRRRAGEDGEEQQRGDVVERGAECEQADEAALPRGSQPAAREGDEQVDAQRDVEGLAEDAQRDQHGGVRGLEREGHGSEAEQDEQRPDAARRPPAPPGQADQPRHRDQVSAVCRREARVGQVVAAQRERYRHGDEKGQRERRRPPRRERGHTGAQSRLVRDERGQRK